MKKMKIALLGVLLIGSWIPQTVLSKTVTLINSAGERAHLEVGASDQFLDVLDMIQSYYNEYDYGLQASHDSKSQELAAEGIPLDIRCVFEFSHAGITVRSKKPVWRDYSVSVTKQEKKDMAYIITTLANDNLISVGVSKSSLKKAGDRIDHLHPFRFLITVFADEELKAGIHAIRDRGGWIWEGFIDGLTGSIEQEAAGGNLLQFTTDFAKKVKIQPSLIQPSLEKGKWSEFVDVLIDKIPREIDPNRYDM